MLIIAITYQTHLQGLLYCRSHIGKREDPGDEAGHISIGHMLVYAHARPRNGILGLAIYYSKYSLAR